MIDNPQQTSSCSHPLEETVRGGAAELLDLGITAHRHTTYEWNGYRYSNIVDAIAAARRAAR